jgi:hypothetical protein
MKTTISTVEFGFLKTNGTGMKINLTLAVALKSTFADFFLVGSTTTTTTTAAAAVVGLGHQGSGRYNYIGIQSRAKYCF